MLSSIVKSSLLCLLMLSTAVMADSRGIRNNNPGNIIATSIQWRGEVPCKDVRFTCFSTPSYGIRAMMVILRTYQDKHKLYTISQMMNRWAPKNENDLEAIREYMHRTINTGLHTIFDLHDKDNMVTLVRSIIKLENGYQPYTNEYIGDIYDTIRNSDRWSERTSRRDDEVMGYEYAGQEGTAYTAHECSQITGRSPSRGEEYKGRRIHVDKESYCIDDDGLCLRTTEDRSIVWYRCYGGVLRMVARLPIF